MTREEAIKEAYGIPVTKAQHEALQFLIPELCESEDERIAGAIRGIVSRYFSNNFNRLSSNVDEVTILTWLEKKKDASKAIEAVERIDKYIDEHLANAHDMKDSNPDKKYYRGWDDALGKMAGILQDVYSDEKQKEQKPVQTEEEREYIRTLKGLVSDFIHNSCSNITDGIGYIDVSYYQKIYDWLEGRHVEQKPAEWSEEDKMNLNGCICSLHQYGYMTYADFLKHLPERFNLQPKQEWSEEDERMLRRCIKSVESSKNFAETQTFKEAKDKEKEWLISLPERFNLRDLARKEIE